MSKHIEKNGNLIKVDKKWDDLKRKQKDWISFQLQTEYIKLADKEKLTISKNNKEEVLDIVYRKIEEKGIWISYEEVKKYYSSKLNDFNKILSDLKREKD